MEETKQNLNFILNEWKIYIGEFSKLAKVYSQCYNDILVCIS